MTASIARVVHAKRVGAEQPSSEHRDRLDLVERRPLALTGVPLVAAPAPQAGGRLLSFGTPALRSCCRAFESRTAHCAARGAIGRLQHKPLWCWPPQRKVRILLETARPVPIEARARSSLSRRSDAAALAHHAHLAASLGLGLVAAVGSEADMRCGGGEEEKPAAAPCESPPCRK